MKALWSRLKLFFTLEPRASELTYDEVFERTRGRVTKFVLGLYNAGYDPTYIARLLIDHALALVTECGGPVVDYSQLTERHAALEKILVTERARRMMTPPSDRVAVFLRRKEFRPQKPRWVTKLGILIIFAVLLFLEWFGADIKVMYAVTAFLLRGWLLVV